MIIITSQYFFMTRRSFSTRCNNNNFMSSVVNNNHSSMLKRFNHSNNCNSGASLLLSSSSSFSFSSSSSSYLFQQMRFAARATHAEITCALNVLGVTVEETKDPKGFKKKYIDLVRKNHPDKGGSEDKMKNITTAYDLLSNLSDFDKKEYGSRQKYSGGSTNTARNQAYQQRAYNTQQAYDFHDMYRKQYESGGSGPSAQGKTDYSTYKGQAQTNDPFGAWRGGMHTGSGESTGSFSRGMYGARRLPNTVIFFRAMVIYSVVVMFIVIVQRANDDYTNQSGWSAASKMARQDRLEQLFETRQEFIDKIRSRDLSQRMDKERQKEKRMYDYAAQRQAELNKMEFGSFPPLPQDGRMGSVFKIPADPIGILYYEPPMKNSFESAMLPAGALVGAGGTGNFPPSSSSNNNNLQSASGLTNTIQMQQQQSQALSNTISYNRGYNQQEQQQQQQQQQPSSPVSAASIQNFARNPSFSQSSGENILQQSVRDRNIELNRQQQRQEILKREAQELTNFGGNTSASANPSIRFATPLGGGGNSNSGYSPGIRVNRQESSNKDHGNSATYATTTSPNVSKRSDPVRNDPADFNPELDSHGHEGMVARPSK